MDSRLQEPLVRVERKSAVTWLTLNSPGNLNAMTQPLMAALKAAIEATSADKDVRCVVIIGTGKAFSVGGDLRGFLSDLADPNDEQLIGRLEVDQALFRQIESLPMPVIAAVNGYAIAGGLELLLCCDIVIAAESAQIGDGHAKYGIIPAGGGSARLPRKISANRANEMLLTARLYPARAMEDWGLVNRVVPDVQLTETAEALAADIASHSPLGIRIMKKLAGNSLKVSSDDAQRAELEAFRDYCRSHDFAEGLAAFIERRKPMFSGQ